ncbi:MAG: PhzF family phenazine biosynthesis protein [Flavisolibacter sp.]
MHLDIYQVDAFAQAVFKGNPAAIVPLNEWMDDYMMQQIAMENNQSETAYFVPTKDGYHIRWFTPEYEMDLCGHATLAAAYIIRKFLEPQLKIIHFSTEKAGNLKVSVTEGALSLDFPARMPVKTAIPPQLLQSLQLREALEVLKFRDYFVVLPDEASVAQVQPDYNLLKQLDAVGIIVTAKGQTADVVSRCFYPGAGVPEDPVTGSAHCCIVPYWAEKLNKQKLHCRQLSQRGGDLYCELKGDRVLMEGSCVLYLKGTIEI